jgi:alkylhydroperoxidase/carboxymuconolactone decarboxylase family protein YurZ
MPDDDETLVRRFIGGQHRAADEIQQRAVADNTPILLVAAALLADEPDDLLGRAGRSAVTARDRQLVVIAAAYLAGQHDRLDALVRDHLADHPGNILAAWIAAQPARPVNPTAPTSTPHR